MPSRCFLAGTRLKTYDKLRPLSQHSNLLRSPSLHGVPMLHGNHVSQWKKKVKHTQNYKNSTLRRALRTRLSKRVPPPWLAATFLLPCTGRPPPTSEQTSCGHSSRRTQSRWLGNRRAETNTSRRASITYPRHELSGTAIGLPISWGCFEGQCRHICGSSIGRVWGWPSEFATRHCKRGTLPDAQAPDSRAIHDIPAVDPRNTERRHHQTTASAIVMRESWSGAI